MLILSSALVGGCGDTPEPPAWCSAVGDLNLTCDTEQCIAAVVVDYKRLEPRGYRTFSLQGDPITRQQAETVASDYLVTELQANPPDTSDCVQEDDFIHCAMVYDNQDRYLVVLHRLTGSVVFAEPEIWADPDKRGYDFDLPSGFFSADAIGCVEPIAQPVSKRLVTTGIPIGTPIPSTADEALEVVRKLNVAERFTHGNPYKAFVISHAPALGEFDPEAADWYVWISLP